MSLCYENMLRLDRGVGCYTDIFRYLVWTAGAALLRRVTGQRHGAASASGVAIYQANGADPFSRMNSRAAIDIFYSACSGGVWRSKENGAVLVRWAAFRAEAGPNIAIDAARRAFYGIISRMCACSAIVMGDRYGQQRRRSGRASKRCMALRSKAARIGAHMFIGIAA